MHAASRAFAWMPFPDGMVDALDPGRLRLLVEVKRRGSISAAADVCRMGQPSATKHLQTLEAAVGDKLVERRGRASQLTEAGEVVAAHALRVLDTLEGMQEDLRALASAERGTLTLAASTTPGSYVLPSILQCFADRHPRVDVDVVIGSSAWVAERVARREVQLGLAGELDLPDGVVAEAFRDGKRRIAVLLWAHAGAAPTVPGMYFRQLLNDATACASYLFGCKTHSRFAVVDPHADLVDEYVRLADAQVLKLGNTEIEAVATPGHALAHHAYLVTDRTRGDEPWLVLTGDALLVGDAGRPDLHAHGDQTAESMARALYRSLTERLLALPDHLVLYPAHYSGSVCGRGLSSNPISTVGFERRHNAALQAGSEEAFVRALLADLPPAPDQQAEIVAANRAGR